MRIMITGGAGYLGTELTRRLSRRSDVDEVLVYDNLSRANFNLLIGGIQGAAEKGLEVTNLKEVLNEEALEDLTSLIPDDAILDAGFLFEEMCFNQNLDRAPRGWSVEVGWPVSDPVGSRLNLICAGDPVRAPTAVDRLSRAPDFLLVLNRKAMWRPIEWAVHAQNAPYYQVKLDGVSLLSLYRLR